jgi:2,3-bisphosphoglycerate-independent phosphoglycerate mutase
MRHGILADVAPTMLHVLGIPAPPEMTGKSLLIPRAGKKTERP